MPIIFVTLQCNNYIINNKNKNVMKKAFLFLESLNHSHFDLLGYPTVQFSSGYVEVYFDCYKTIKELDILRITGYDEMRFFPGGNCIKFVYKFYNEDN